MDGRAFLGCDPGLQGALVAITPVGIKVCRFGKATAKDMWTFLSELSFDYQCFCIKEKVWAMPATNSAGEERKMGASTSFVFGENNGFIKGLLVAAEIPFEEVTPQGWQKHYSLKKEKNEEQPAYKRRMKQRAEQLFPKENITADVADAFLLAEVCRRLRA